MQDIILYAALAIVVGGLLYSVLGKNVGQDPKQDPRQDLKQNKDANHVLGLLLGNPDAKKRRENTTPPMPVFTGPAAAGLGQIFAADARFNLPQFLDGAKGAYGMILEAFAAGDKATLATLLNDEVKDIYYTAIDDLKAKDLTQTTDLARLIDAKVVSAEKSGKSGIIRVAYFAELATALTDKDGVVVKGDLDMLSRVRETWSYERILDATDPNWRLSGVEPHTSDNSNAGGPDAGGPDHSPDT